MSGLLTFVFIIVVIVGFHESAHFAFMKLWGVKVIRFSIGFGPVLFSKKIGETEYQIASIPLGGYVLPLSRKMDGVEDYKMHAEPGHPEKYFESKPAWQRVIIYLAGPFSNLLFAYVLYFLLFTCVGLPNPTTSVGALAAGYPAEQSGLKPGDKIEAIDGKPVKTWEDIVNGINGSGGKAMKILVLRKAEQREFSVIAKGDPSGDKTVYRIGVQPAVEYIRMSAYSAIKASDNATADAVSAYGSFFKKLFTGKAEKGSFGGPIMIYELASESAKQGVTAVVILMIMINMSLFAFNLLPIPGLDGGQIYPILFEMLTGIKMSPRVEYCWQMFGVLILASIFISAMWNDIARLLAR